MKDSLNASPSAPTAEGLLDVAYANVRLALRAAAPRRHAARPGPGQPARPTTPRRRWRTWRRGSRRGCSRPRRGFDEARRELDLYFEGKLTEFDLPLDWQLTNGFRRQGAAGDRPHPLRPDPQLHRDRPQRRQRARRPRRRHRLRLQPDPDRRPLPPRPAQRRRPRRLRRRPADEGSAAEAGGRALGGVGCGPNSSRARSITMSGRSSATKWPQRSTISTLISSA